MPETYHLDELKIELTQECPLACIHCSTRSNRFMRSRLPLEVVTRILCEAHELGARKVALTGGEPLVYPRLLALNGGSKTAKQAGVTHPSGPVIFTLSLGARMDRLMSTAWQLSAELTSRTTPEC